MTQRDAGFREGAGAGTRSGSFLSRYHELKKGLKDNGMLVDTFVSIGLERTTAGQFSAGLTAGGVEGDDIDDWRDDDTLDKSNDNQFTRDMWENN